MNKRITILFLSIILTISLTSSSFAAQAKLLQVHFINVGQGASQLIISPSGKTMLIDAGNNDQEDDIVAYLNKQKIKKIDVLVGTHPDADHIGGLDAVIDNFDIGSVYLPKVHNNTKTFEDVLNSIKNKNLKVNTAKSGMLINLDKSLTVKMLAPVGTYDELNNMSVVIRLIYGSTSFLLTGDAEQESENDMLKSKANLKSDVLLVGHHGSNSSTSQKFLNAVNPKYAVIQVGKNSYGHPTDATLKKLSSKKITVYRNDKHGNIIFISDGKSLKVSTEKSPSSNIKQNTKTTNPSTTTKTTNKSTNVTYKNCSEVRAAGKAPLYKGDPGYSTKLDRDKDGVACE